MRATSALGRGGSERFGFPPVRVPLAPNVQALARVIASKRLNRRGIVDHLLEWDARLLLSGGWYRRSTRCGETGSVWDSAGSGWTAEYPGDRRGGGGQPTEETVTIPGGLRQPGGGTPFASRVCVRFA